MACPIRQPPGPQLPRRCRAGAAGPPHSHHLRKTLAAQTGPVEVLFPVALIDPLTVFRILCFRLAIETHNQVANAQKLQFDFSFYFCLIQHAFCQQGIYFFPLNSTPAVPFLPMQLEVFFADLLGSLHLR